MKLVTATSTLTSLLVLLVNSTFADVNNNDAGRPLLGEDTQDHRSLRQTRVPGTWSKGKIGGGGIPQKQSNPCLLLIKATEYEDGSSEETLSCELDEEDAPGQPVGYGKRVVDLTGMSVEEFQSQGLMSGSSYLSSTAGANDDDGEELYDTELKVKRGKFKIEPATTMNQGGFGRGSTGQGRGQGKIGRDITSRQLQNGTNNRKTLVVRVIASDASTTANTDTLSDKMFGTSGDPVNLRTQYAACSNDIVDFYPATSADNGSINDNGTTTVNISMNVNGASDSTVRTAVENALTAQISNWRTQFEHTVMCLPPGTAGSWIGYAYLNSYRSVFNNEWCNYVSIQMHELGHNLGLGHSGEGTRSDFEISGDTTQYGDKSGMMGFSYSSDNTPQMCFNGAKTYNFGWYSSHTMELNPIATPAWTGDMVNPATYTGIANQMVVIKIETAPGVASCSTCYDYYVMFNRASDFNSGTQEGANQVLITEQADTGSNNKSNLMAKLSSGQSFTVSNFGGASGTYVRITVNSINLSTNLANVSIVHSTSCTITNNCDDGDACNGVETCNAGTGLCEAGTPLVCDDNDPCNGVETCNASTGCVAGTPITCDASEAPSTTPSGSPSSSPSTSPSSSPSTSPSSSPSTSPSSSPSTSPSLNPSISVVPSVQPSGSPSQSIMPSDTATLEPTTSSAPSEQPSVSPSLSAVPSDTPSSNPSTSSSPSNEPSVSPSVSLEPSLSPSISSVPSTSNVPTGATDAPSESTSPSAMPSSSVLPSGVPSDSPSLEPSSSPSLSMEPSLSPSVSAEPSEQPSDSPSLSSEPSAIPSSSPSTSEKPSDTPSLSPSSSSSPSDVPSSSPSDVPSSTPSLSEQPSNVPSGVPSISTSPSSMPSDVPSLTPTSGPTDGPTMEPTEISQCWASIYFTDFETAVARRGWIDGGKDAKFSNKKQFDAEFESKDGVTIDVSSSSFERAKKGDKRDKKKNKDKKNKDKKKDDKQKDKPKENRVTMHLTGGSASSNMAKELDLSICDMVTVNFFFHTGKLDGGELFYFKMWDGVGVTPTYQDIKIWEMAGASGTPSIPGAALMDTETAYSVTLSNIDTSSYTSNARIRFEFQGQKKNDDIYVDNVEVMCLCSYDECPAGTCA